MIIYFVNSCHVETVAFLSKLRTTQHIDVDLDLTELDVTAAEAKATYAEIQAYVLEHTGLRVSCLYIAQVKAKYGIIERECYNKAKTEVFFASPSCRFLQNKNAGFCTYKM